MFFYLVIQFTCLLYELMKKEKDERLSVYLSYN